MEDLGIGDQLSRHLPRSGEATSPSAYVRLPGDREGVGALTRTLDHIVIDRGEQVAADAEAIKLLAKRVPVVAFVNNHFAGYAPETARQLALLGTLPDAEVARRTGRAPNAVRLMRERRGIPNPAGNRWTAEGLALLGTLPDREVARRLGRSLSSVTQKRCQLGIANPFDERRRG
jgi:hypothetical protein